MSIVSVAFRVAEKENIYAWPFDQGTRDKQAQPQLDLYGDPNLDRDEWEALLGWLSQQRLIFHNGKHDLAQLRVGTRHWAGLELEGAFWWDTMVAAREIWPIDSVGLDAVSKRLGIGEKTELGKKRGVSKGRYDLYEWDQIDKYAANDPWLTYQLWEAELEAIDQGQGDRKIIDHRMDVLRVLYHMERRGMCYDSRGSRTEAAKIGALIKQLEAQLPFQPATLPAAKAYFFGTAGVLPYKTTDKGNPQLDDEVLWKMERDQVKWAHEFGEIRKLQVAQSMWYQGYADKCGEDGRLRTNFRQTKVVSGRMSVERVQLHAIPKDDKTIEGIRGVREFFGADQGKELWNLDLSQAELRVASKYAKCTRMLEMLEAGVDLHGVTTKAIFGINEQAKDWKAKRDIAKRLTFGGIFQIGAHTYQKTLAKQAHIELPLGECEQIVREWRGLYPEYGKAYSRAERVFRTRGWVRQLPGTEWETRSWLGPLDYPNTGWSRMVQGSLAQFLQIWLVEAEVLLQKLGAPEALLLTVHDSLVIELPIDRGEEIAREVALAGAARATELFSIEMRVDTTRWHS